MSEKISEEIAINLPRLWCAECPYKETMHLCAEGKACRWQLDYAEKILSHLKSQIEQMENPFEGYVDVIENIRMAKSQGFERFREYILAKLQRGIKEMN